MLHISQFKANLSVISFVLLLLAVGCKKESINNGMSSSSDPEPKSTTNQNNGLEDGLEELKEMNVISDYSNVTQNSATIVLESSDGELEEVEMQKVDSTTTKLYTNNSNDWVAKVNLEFSEDEYYPDYAFEDNPNNPDDFPAAALPRQDHEGEDFCECFESDYDDFCDGLIGCVARSHPMVSVAIAAHCVYHTGTTQCD